MERIFHLLVAIRERGLSDQALVNLRGGTLERIRAIKHHANQIASNANWTALAPEFQLEDSAKTEVTGKGRIHGRLQEWDQLEQLDQLAHRAEIWEKAAGRSSGAMVLQGVEEWQEFLALGEGLGFLAEVEPQLPDNPLYDPEEEIFRLIGNAGAPSKRVKWLRQKIESRNSQVRAGAVAIGIAPKGRWANRHNLATGFYILRVYARLGLKNFPR